MRLGKRKKQKSIWIRSAALLTMLVFTMNSVLWANGTNLSKPLLPASNTAQDTAGKNLQSILNRLKLPGNIGEIKSRFQGSSDYIVIHIQDAHINEEAQRNIAQIIDYLYKHQKMNLVHLEGAQGELYTELYSFFPNQKARRSIADYYLKKGRLTGPEYLAIVDRPDLKLVGVEDRKIYEENRQAYLEAVDFVERDEKILSQVENILQDMERFVFSNELRELYRHKRGFQNQGSQLTAYVRYLAEKGEALGLDFSHYRNIELFLEILSLEEQKDSAAQAELVSDLSSEYFFDEIENLEDEIKDEWLRSEDQKKLDHVIRIFDVYRKMFEFSLTKQDADFFYSHRDEFNAVTFRAFLEPLLKKFRFTHSLPVDLAMLDTDLQRIERFYHLALSRDEILIEKTIESMNRLPS